jgi:asparagine synthase (glutamine-hydrolysing)
VCGIAGICDLDGRSISAGHLLAMNRAIAHRGPDDEGYVLVSHDGFRTAAYAGSSSPQEIRDALPSLEAESNTFGASIGLAHRRFSIIDLSAAGHQPFFDAERSCCVTFNGEIYNYLEVRDELRRHGVRFSSQSDTEVLVEAYKHWGPDAFSRLNGFWALALFDFRNRHLVLSRDRIGKRPLYWTRVDNRVFFASEIKSLLEVPEVRDRRRVNDEAVYRWLAFGRKDLDFSTCFHGIHSLPAASWAIVDARFPENAHVFWRVPEPGKRLNERDISVDEAATALRETLQESVRIRLRADVPLSVELSGGLDSSTLVALAAQAYSGPITTYTIRFPEKQWNEESFARSVGERYAVDYRVIDSPTENFWADIRPFTHLEEEPYHSPNLQTNQVIWTQMRAMGTKVSLNGAGGDENFAGYSQYYLAAQTERLLKRQFGSYLRNALRYSEGRTNIRVTVNPVTSLAGEAFGRLGLRRTKRLSFYRGPTYPGRKAQPLSLAEALYSDMTNTLMPYWLRSGDRGYMGIPLEVRAPFLDYRVIELAFTLPTGYLFRDGWHKWILRKAVEDILPADVVWRRNKMGFPFPYGRFQEENRRIVDLILDRASNPYIDLTQRRMLGDDWRVIGFLLWYEYFFNDNLSLFDAIEAAAREAAATADYGFTPHFLQSCGVAA